MPEGHVVHRLAAQHASLLSGVPVRTSSPQGRFSAGAARLDGSALLGTDAHGKHLFHEYATPAAGPVWLHVHLGLYGTFSTGASPAPPPTGQIRLRWHGPGGYLDLRGPAACELLTEPEKQAIHARLGADPLRPDAGAAAPAERVLRSRAPIGRLLLDQSVIAGVGVAYRAEVLFRLGIDPQRPGRALGATTWRALWQDLTDLMRDGARTGRIDTVRPEHTPQAMGRPPREDRHGGEVYVYRRAGRPCLVCGTPVQVTTLAARNLYWCPTCQPTGQGSV